MDTPCGLSSAVVSGLMPSLTRSQASASGFVRLGIVMSLRSPAVRAILLVRQFNDLVDGGEKLTGCLGIR